MQTETRSWLIAILIGFIPDLLVSWAAAKLTDSGWTGFFITLAVLNGIYFFLWVKRTTWAWIVYWVYGKAKMSDYVLNYFAQHDFPEPQSFTCEFDEYLREIVSKEDLGTLIRLKAASDLGTLEGIKTAQRFTLFFQFSSAGSDAVARYARQLKNKPAARPTAAPSVNPNPTVNIEMPKQELETVAWLADYGLRVWTQPDDTPLRPGKQTAYSHAQSLSDLLEKFERKIVPDLLQETEEEKEQRFTASENRMKTLWHCYPQHTS